MASLDLFISSSTLGEVFTDCKCQRWWIACGSIFTFIFSNAFGGNPCPAANTTPNYQCRLNINGPWDYSVPSGYYVLFSAPGSQGYIITGPHRFYPQGRVTVPAVLQTATIKEIDVVFMTFNQVPRSYSSIVIQVWSLFFFLSLVPSHGRMSR